MSEEQSVVGLVLASMERLKSVNAKYDLNQVSLLQWIGELQMIDRRNKAMNTFGADLIEKLLERSNITK